MITEKMQNDVWTSLPKDFKDEIKKIYNRPCYSIGALHVNDTLDWLFGIENLTEDKAKEEEQKEREMLKNTKNKVNMERKIGEIFKFGGEWYQCVEDKSCNRCAFKGTKCGDISKGYCSARYRSDKKSVIFKKLEKVGEPYVKRVSDSTFSKFQRYKVYDSVVLPKEPYIYCNFIDSTVEIEIKQNKEDMEEYKMYDAKEDISEFDKAVDDCLFGEDKPNLKPFDLEAAKAGKPVCTKDGRKARIICFDAKCADTPIVALVSRKNEEEYLLRYYRNGKFRNDEDSDADLMMLPEKKEGWVNVYKIGVYYSTGNNIYSSKEEAERRKDDDYITTIRIEWEE